MIPRKILESSSIRELYRFMLENRLSRKALFGIVRKRLRRDLVDVNEDDGAAMKLFGMNEVDHQHGGELRAAASQKHDFIAG